MEAAMTKTFKAGDQVSWNTSQGETSGKVVRKQTSQTTIKGHVVKASKDDPQYIVESSKSGKKAAQMPMPRERCRRAAMRASLTASRNEDCRAARFLAQ
jgi:hypothetical protein